MMKVTSLLTAGFCAALLLLLPPAATHAQDPGSTVIPEVSVVATSWKTAEPCPVCLVVPGILRFERSEVTREPLVLLVATDGTATAGKDYLEFPMRVEIPAGETFVDVYLAPLDDELVEGPEVVRVRILPREEAYRIRPGQSEALVVIGDIEMGVKDIPTARLDIIRPSEGAQVRPDTILKIEAIVVWTEGEVQQPIDFFAGDKWIGHSAGVPVLRPPIPGLPSVQTVYWTNPPAGDHLLTARVDEGPDGALKSPPIHITVGEKPIVPVVSIEATSPIAEESSYPFRRLRFDGLLTIHRTGPTNFSMPVFIHYSGTATPKDFESAPPWLVSIPEGAASVEIKVLARPDEIEEGIETLVATLSNCPPETDPPLGMPCFGFEIDPAQASATIFLRDDGITRASIAIHRPEDGSLIPANTPIRIEAEAIDLESYISRVEFFDGDRRIGVSEIVFVRPPDPGTPIHHHFTWTGAEPGGHVLTARAAVGDDLKISSAPVRIKVDGEINQPPRVAIVQPESGAVFPPMTPIEWVAVANDPDGFVRKVTFLANGRQVGEVGWGSDRRPVPGEPQRFVFVWRYPLPGPQVLTVRAVDNTGQASASEPVKILIEMPLDRPVVTVVARDPFAVEPAGDRAANTATFLVRRFGGLDRELTVSYSLRGSAENGVDYERLSGWVRFAANQLAATVVIQPLADRESEGAETVILRLEESLPTNIEPAVGDYRIGYRGRSVALIRDQPWNRDEGRKAFCLPLGDRIMHVCFSVEDGKLYRMEASPDMRRWETVHDGIATDGAIHFVDEESGEFEHRFYRVAPMEPLVLP